MLDYLSVETKGKDTEYEFQVDNRDNFIMHG